MTDTELSLGPIIVVALIVGAWIITGLRVIQEYEAGVIFRLGRFAEVKRAGLNWLVPFLDRMVKIDLRTVTRDVPPQDVITRDNVSLKVSAVIYFRVLNAEKAVIQVENYLYATSQLAQTTLRSTLGKLELDDLLAQREKINKELQQVLDLHTEPWGIKVSAVEVKQLDLPLEMQRAMARQAEAERERRAKVIAAEGEYQAAEKLGMAADVIDAHPAALQLRYLQTLVEISGDKSSTTIFPMPIDLINQFLGNPSRPARAFPAPAPAPAPEALAAPVALAAPAPSPYAPPPPRGGERG